MPASRFRFDRKSAAAPLPLTLILSPRAGRGNMNPKTRSLGTLEILVGDMHFRGRRSASGVQSILPSNHEATNSLREIK